MSAPDPAARTTRQNSLLRISACALLWAAGCGESPASVDAGSDASSTDAGLTDVGLVDVPLADTGDSCLQTGFGFQCVVAGDGSARVRFYRGSADPTAPCEFDEIRVCSAGCPEALHPGVYLFRDLAQPLHPDDARRFCEEGRPRVPGDPCGDDDDCRDSMPEFVGDFSYVFNYLRCEAGTCVTRDAPDWSIDVNARCTDAALPDERQGLVETELCSEGVCVFERRADCVATACTGGCDFDSDCWDGWRCERPSLSEPNADGERVPLPQTVGPGVCRQVEGFDHYCD